MARGARQIGMILLGIWLVFFGILTVTGIGDDFPMYTTFTGAIAILAGILLLIGRSNG